MAEKADLSPADLIEQLTASSRQPPEVDSFAVGRGKVARICLWRVRRR